MNLFISPHNDDETLFGAFTIIREKPLVLLVTDSYIQPNRGDLGCGAEERWEETRQALTYLGGTAIRGRIRDDALDESALRELFKKFFGFTKVYIPAEQGGNWQHDLISRVAQDVFGSACVQYTTYTKRELHTTGNIEITPTEEEKELKLKALNCYRSQLSLGSTLPHFQAVLNKSEWLL